MTAPIKSYADIQVERCNEIMNDCMKIIENTSKILLDQVTHLRAECDSRGIDPNEKRVE